jgi:hypothetical protein
LWHLNPDLQLSATKLQISSSKQKSAIDVVVDLSNNNSELVSVALDSKQIDLPTTKTKSKRTNVEVDEDGEPLNEWQKRARGTVSPTTHIRF